MLGSSGDGTVLAVTPDKGKAGSFMSLTAKSSLPSCQTQDSWGQAAQSSGPDNYPNIERGGEMNSYRQETSRGVVT